MCVCVLGGEGGGSRRGSGSGRRERQACPGRGAVRVVLYQQGVTKCDWARERKCDHARSGTLPTHPRTYAARCWRAGAPCPVLRPTAWPPLLPMTGSSPVSAVGHTGSHARKTCTDVWGHVHVCCVCCWGSAVTGVGVG